jgi:hypothetical protein
VVDEDKEGGIDGEEKAETIVLGRGGLDGWLERCGADPFSSPSSWSSSSSSITS